LAIAWNHHLPQREAGGSPPVTVVNAAFVGEEWEMKHGWNLWQFMGKHEVFILNHEILWFCHLFVRTDPHM